MPLSGPALHHHAYSFDAETKFFHWQVDGEILSWKGVAPARLTKAADWWWATRSSSSTRTSYDHTARPFALQVRLRGLGRSVASVLKPMLDGMIAGFHRDDSPDDKALSRLAGQLRQPERDTRSLLGESDGSLGTRILVRQFREGLQWNPADDLCVACSVEVAHASGPAAVEGRLLSVLPPTG